MGIRMSHTQWQQLSDYLSHEIERFAFMYARINQSGEYEVVEIQLLGPEEYMHQERAGLQLVDDVRPKVIQHALATHTAIIEAHSHYGLKWPACFSDLDMSGLAEMAPHMLWRLHGKPYFAMVLANGSFDAIVWPERDKLSTIAYVRVDDVSMKPTGFTLSGEEHD